MASLPKKILIASLGTRGDVQPYAALAAELSSLGAEVVLCTGQGFQTMIEGAGARARPLPVNYQDLLRDTEVQQALFSLRGKIKVARQSIDMQRDVTRALWAIGLEERPDLILFNLKATVMTLVGRRLDVPALPTALQPVTAPTADFPVPLFGLPDFGARVNRWSYAAGRRLMKAGLAPMLKPIRAEAAEEISLPGDQMDGHAPDGGKALTLQAYSRALVPRPADWTDQNWLCGYWFTEPDPAYAPPPELADFLQDGPPPVYIGFGSMPSARPEHLTDTVLAALKATGQRAILATGWGGLVRDRLGGETQKNILLLEKAPHSWLFPRCAAIVHHGGAGTTHEALRWGKPSLVCPVFADQPFWGERVHRAGAGPAPIRQKALTPDTLAEALKSLEEPAYRSAAQSVAATIASEPGARGTAERLMGAQSLT